MFSSDLDLTFASAPFPWPSLTRVALAASVRFVSSSLNPRSAACMRKEGKKTEAMIFSAPNSCVQGRRCLFTCILFYLYDTNKWMGCKWIQCRQPIK